MENESKREKQILKYKKIFFRFLKDNGAYKSFFINFNNREGCMYDFENLFDLFDFCVDHEVNSIIDQAFIWSKTKEGSNFWRSLNNKFVDLCEKIDMFNN